MRFSKVPLAASLLMILLALPAQAQNWWTPGDAGTEAGKLDELKEKRSVFLSVAFNSTEAEINAQQEATLIRRLVTQTVSAYKGVKLVPTPEQAEFAINVVASASPAPAGAPEVAAPTGTFSANLDPSVVTPLDVTVTVRGRMQRDGTYRPRVVWSMSSQNVHGQPGPAAVFAIDGLIDQLKRVRGEKK
jgi:hypothetical protein